MTNGFCWKHQQMVLFPTLSSNKLHLIIHFVFHYGCIPIPPPPALRNNDNVCFPLSGIVAEKQGCDRGHQHLCAAGGRAIAHKHQVLHPQADRLGLDQVPQLHQGPLHSDHAHYCEL